MSKILRSAWLWEVINAGGISYASYASLASRLRLYSLLSDIIFAEKDMLSTEVHAVLDNSVGPEDYHRDDAMRDPVLEHFQISLKPAVHSLLHVMKIKHHCAPSPLYQALSQRQHLKMTMDW